MLPMLSELLWVPLRLSVKLVMLPPLSPKVELVMLPPRSPLARDGKLGRTSSKLVNDIRGTDEATTISSSKLSNVLDSS